MLQRELYNDILDWIKNGKMALTVTGARQTGKTFLIRECLKVSGKSYIEINFIENPEYISIFNNGGSVKDIIFRLSAICICQPNFRSKGHRKLGHFIYIFTASIVAGCI